MFYTVELTEFLNIFILAITIINYLRFLGELVHTQCLIYSVSNYENTSIVMKLFGVNDVHRNRVRG